MIGARKPNPEVPGRAARRGWGGQEGCKKRKGTRAYAWVSARKHDIAPKG
jgi:hypothetical protein